MQTASQRIIEQRKERLLLGAKYRIPEATLILWRFLVTYIDENCYAPSKREMANGCYLSTTSVDNHLQTLEDRGYIRRPVKRIARAIQLLKRPV